MVYKIVSSDPQHDSGRKDSIISLCCTGRNEGPPEVTGKRKEPKERQMEARERGGKERENQSSSSVAGTLHT